MIELYKMINGLYDPEACTLPSLHKDSAIRTSTRGNPQKLTIQWHKSELRKNSFSVRSAKLWNNLPEKVVNAPSDNAFKSRLDKHWSEQEVYYDNYKAKIIPAHWIK